MRTPLSSDDIKSTNRKSGNLSNGLPNLERDLIPFHTYNVHFLRCQILDVIEQVFGRQYLPIPPHQDAVSHLYESRTSLPHSALDHSKFLTNLIIV